MCISFPHDRGIKVRQYPKTILALIFLISLFFVAIITIELTSAQEQSKGRLLKGKATLWQQKKLEYGRGRDPFLLPPGVRILSQSDAVPVVKKTALKPGDKPPDIPPPSLRVKAILISDRIRLASIDRHIVAVGDLINDERVLEIENDRVILRKGDKKRTLLLSQSPVLLTVEEK